MRAGASIEDRRRTRVIASHSIAIAALRMAGVFAVGAIGWAAWVLLRGGSWWGPAHTFLLGTVSLAIAGASQMFTITWSAAPSPPASTAAVQRWSQAAGAVTVLVGVTVGVGAVVIVGGTAVLVGMATLFFSLVSAVGHSLLKRFDLSSRFYLLGLLCGAVGVTLGILMSTGGAGTAYATFRLVHGHLNLVGFVGFTIIGTLPTILPTFAHHRVVSGREAVIAWRLAIASATAMAAGLLLGRHAVAVGSLAAGCSLAAVTVGVVVRLGRTGLRGRVAYLQTIAGCLWLSVWAVADAIRLIAGESVVAFDTWVAVAVVAGVGQVLAGSLAYLIPVLAGPAPILARNFARFEGHPWLPLGAANVAGLAILLGVPVVAVPVVGLWCTDFVRRLVGVERTSRDRS